MTTGRQQAYLGMGITMGNIITSRVNSDSGVRPQTVERSNTCEGLLKEAWGNPERNLEKDSWKRNARRGY